MFVALFEAALVLKINLPKFEIVPVGNVASLASIFGCGVALLPIKYLGLPLDAHYKANTIWSSIIEKMENRLAGWKRLYLSKGSTLTLIKSTLSNLPTYPRIICDFFLFLWEWLIIWKNFKGTFFGVALVANSSFIWSKVCTPKNSRVLGVRNMLQINQSLLGKWLWRLAMERDTLWRKLVDIEYDSTIGGGGGSGVGLVFKGGRGVIWSGCVEIYLERVGWFCAICAV